MFVFKSPGDRSAIWALAFSPDGRTLASGHSSGPIRLRDLQNGECRLLATTFYPKSLSFSTNGHFLACGFPKGVDLHNITTGTRQGLVDLPLPEWNPWYVQCSPDGRHVAAVGLRYLRIWDLHQAEPELIRSEETNYVQRLAYSADGKSLASSHCVVRYDQIWQHWIELRESATGLIKRRLEGLTTAPNCLAIRPGDSTLAAACRQFLVVWDVPSGEILARHKIDLRHFQSIAFTPDGRFLLAARNDQSVHVWDSDTWRKCAAFDWKIGPLVSLSIAPDGMRAAAGSKRGKIVVWDLDF